MGSRRSYSFGNASESADGRGQICSFIIGDGEFSVLVPAPRVDEYGAFALDGWSILLLIDEKFAILLHSNCIFKLFE